jgi:ADP-ribosylglycohydrolase
LRRLAFGCLYGQLKTYPRWPRLPVAKWFHPRFVAMVIDNPAPSESRATHSHDPPIPAAAFFIVALVRSFADKKMQTQFFFLLHLTFE